VTCSNPFPLSASDAIAFQNDVSNLDELPPWGGMYVWNRRLILAFEKPDSTWVFSDVTGGIPWSQAKGGCIPGEALIYTFSRGEYISPTEAFFMSLPTNFLQLAKERFDQMIEMGLYVINASGDVIENISDKVLAPVTKPLAEVLIPLAVIAGVIAIFVYLPKRQSA
jgi:hypothetical protein